MAGKRGGKKPKATKPKAKAKSKSKPKPKRAASRSSAQRSIDAELPGYVVVDSGPKASPSRSARVGKTAPLARLRSKYSVAHPGLDPEPAPQVAQGHGRIVRVRPARKNRDPADEIGDKAVYLDPKGNVEFRQG